MQKADEWLDFGDNNMHDIYAKEENSKITPFHGVSMNESDNPQLLQEFGFWSMLESKQQLRYLHSNSFITSNSYLPCRQFRMIANCNRMFKSDMHKLLEIRLPYESYLEICNPFATCSKFMYSLALNWHCLSWHENVLILNMLITSGFREAPNRALNIFFESTHDCSELITFSKPICDWCYQGIRRLETFCLKWKNVEWLPMVGPWIVWQSYNGN